jgi:BASS family bile acid:Na+ symporter
MSDCKMKLVRIRAAVQKHFLWLLVGSYVLAATWPEPGESLRGLAFTTIVGGPVFSLPMALLALLLFNAGIGANVSELAAVFRKPRALLAGLVGNLLVPIGFLQLLSLALQLWPDSDEAQSIVVGLAVVAAMPIAGSSTAWAQNANGSAALSLGLVLFSTLLSPMTTPMTLTAIEPMTGGPFARALGEMGGHGTGSFLVACVVIPSLLGIGCRYFCVGRSEGFKPTIKLINSMLLLVLCYTNASSVLPQIVQTPDWDFLALCVVAVVILCLGAFMTGWILARLVQASEPQARSLVFAMGMSNNGTGIVLACSALAGLPGAVLPVLIYNLVQHLVAGGVKRRLDESHGE